MWQQVCAIWWAQFRTSRNHLPRRTWGALLGTAISVFWYGAAVAFGVILALLIPSVPLDAVSRNLGIGLLGVFVFWQVGPLFTMSAGWSLQLNKLLIYPIPTRTLYAIEVFLRLTTAPEMLPVLAGGCIGMLRHPQLHGAWGLCLLFFIPVNLFLSLTVREIVLHSFERNRFRELFTILLVSIGLLPQIIIRTGLGHRLQPYFSALSHSTWSPWGQTAKLSLGTATFAEAAGLLVWTALFFFTSRRLFARSLQSETSLRASGATARQAARDELAAPARARWLHLPARLFADPAAALLEKELRSTVRMPRFRVAFGMACVFSVVVFVPLTFRLNDTRNEFLMSNFLVVVTLYGLLILSDSLMMNIFGTDRGASELYFAAPIDLRIVFRVKNIVAAVFTMLQAALVLLAVLLARMPITLFNLLEAVGSAAVVGLFFMGIGNMSSVMVARPVDPSQTFRKQATAKTQLWLLGSSVGMAVLVGAAFLARWALGTPWAGLAVLGVEFFLALIFYKVALDSAVLRGQRERERLMDTLSKNASPIGSDS